MLNEGPLFTIIIPTYNRSKLLLEAIESVINQSFKNWECIIIDDGSTDNTKNEIETLDDSRIKYFYQKHSERSSARNLGISKAEGKYICFLDDDDVFKKNHLSVLEQEILKHSSPVAILRTNMILCYKGVEIETAKPPYPILDPILYFLENMVGIHTLCFHNTILYEFKFDERWWHFQDTHLFIRALVKYPLLTIPKYTVVYNITEVSGSRNIFQNQDIEERLRNNLDAIQDLFSKLPSEIKKTLGKNILPKLISKKYLDYASGCIHSTKKLKGINLISMAIKTYPRILFNGYFYKTVFQLSKF